MEFGVLQIYDVMHLCKIFKSIHDIRLKYKNVQCIQSKYYTVNGSKASVIAINKSSVFRTKVSRLIALYRLVDGHV